MNFTIQNVLIPVEQGYATVDVQIIGDRIHTIAPNLDIVGTAVNGENKLLLPGFVNAHTHSSEMWQRGMIPPVPLELWIAELYDFAPLEPELVYLSALGTAVETLLSGGTSVVDHLVLIPGKEIETVAAAVRAYQEIGMRAFIGPLIQDASLTQGMPDGGAQREHEPYIHSTQSILALMREVVEKFHKPEDGVNSLVAPTGIQLCSDALLEGCIELTDRYNLCRHSHLLETKAQQKLAQEKYGCSAVEYLKRIGYLSERTSLAHCVWLSEEDVAILAEMRSTVVHNPLSNLRLGSGIAPILKYRQAGVNVAFGCDGSASNDSQDLLEAIKMGSILHNSTEPDYHHWITPRQSMEMASLGGAKGLNLADELGSLTVGKKADLVLYDLMSLSLLPRTDPIGLLILGRPTNVVDSVWINGRQIVANGKVTTIDVDALKQELFARSSYGTTDTPNVASASSSKGDVRSQTLTLTPWSTNRQSQTVSEIEAHYRRVMGLPQRYETMH